ncbi:hypothetical protein [Streptomyces mirabilis]|uniref:hypothetical protein n=1 Tax=Streptomyces mirabilis TaxID=68239 RepID=UPI003321F239
MQFVQDRRLTLIKPDNLEEVDLPVTVQWDTRDFTAAPLGSQPRENTGLFGVFVDRYPMAPGESIRTLVADEVPTCAANPDECLTPAFLRDSIGLYLTTKNRVPIERVGAAQTTSQGVHFVVVVLIDSAGRRIGEAVWYRSFKVRDSS